jgi:uncharacterized protein YbjT (DUF2867 family)
MKNMNVLITGASGMIGKLILNKCLESEQITDVISLVRNPTGQIHHKLIEVIVDNFDDHSANKLYFKNIHAAFFCLGVYTGQVADDLFKKITVDYAVAFAKTLEENSPQARLCLLSGAGADRTEKSNTSFARYKGMAENEIAAMNLKFHSFRPGYIFPVEKRKEPNVGYKIMRALYPVIKLLGNKYSITSTELASAMFNIGLNGSDQQILENQAIVKHLENLSATTPK